MEMAPMRNLVEFLVLFLAACVLCTGEVEFSSDLASVVDRAYSGNEIEWDYSEGPNGPAHWGELSAAWKTCSDGNNQGPININQEHIQLDGTLDVPAKIYYQPAPAFLRGDGKTLEVEWAGGIYNCHKFDYVLEKLIFHVPSEHTYFGERFPLEVQFYHTHLTEGVALNSLVFREGESSKWLQQFVAALPSRENLGKTISLGMIDSAGVEGDDLDWTRYYRYLGSLTTPPCTENPWVVWSLLKAPLTASKEQIEGVKAALLNTPNARPVQPTNTRIYYPRYVDNSN